MPGIPLTVNQASRLLSPDVVSRILASLSKTVSCGSRRMDAIDARRAHRETQRTVCGADPFAHDFAQCAQKFGHS